MTDLAQGQQQSAIYQLINPEPWLATFNDTPDPNNVGTIGGEGITGLDSPEIREAAGLLVEAHGGYHGNFWAGRRPVTIPAEILGNTIDQREQFLERAKRASKALSADGTLRWFPGDPSVVTTSRYNLVNNPSFEYDTTAAAPYGWSNTATGQTVNNFVVSTSNPLTGTKSLRFTTTKDNTATGRSGFVWSNPFLPVEPGATYSFQASVFIADAPVSGSGLQLEVVWYDANGTFINGALNTALAGGATGRQTLTFNGVTAPANAATAQLFIGNGLTVNNTTALDVVDVYIDAVQFVREATAGTYFDGDTANSSWLGILGQSPSANRPNGRQITWRRQQPYRINNIGWKKDIFIPLVAADPRIYSTRTYNYTIAPVTNQTVENQGDEESPPSKLRINGPGTNPTIRRTANAVQQNIPILTTLTAGQYIDVDVLRRTAVRETGVSVYGSIDFTNTTWWGIAPGPSNVVRLDWGSGSTAASTLVLQYKDAWL